MLLETDKRLLWKLAWNMGFKGLGSVQAHKRRLKQGKFFPPYLYISIINSCNLRCQGCWVDVAAKQHKIEVDAMNRMINEAKADGQFVFRICSVANRSCTKSCSMILEAHPDAYFQVFTNGHFITDEVAKRVAQMRQRDAAGQRRRHRNHQRPAARQSRRAVGDDGGSAKLS